MKLSFQIVASKFTEQSLTHTHRSCKMHVNYNFGSLQRNHLFSCNSRFEHREENRKDCLRTLYALIEDAMKADKLAETARNAYVKDRLRANPQFMERLRTKTAKLQGLPQSLPS